MHLKELIKDYATRPDQSVPEWMLGCFKRNSITFANGLTDRQTQVFWLQGRNQTIDLRLPVDDALIHQPFAQCSPAERQQLADYEGWSADSLWQNEQLSWSGGVSFQLHNRWPEPAILHRVGNCMMEFAPSGAYVEDWRLQSCLPGPLISLRLLEERDMTSGELRHRGGALIITGDRAGLVLGRAKAIEGGDQQLRDRLKQAGDDPAFTQQVFNFETSVGQGSLEAGFSTMFSTCADRLGQRLFPLEGFRFDDEHKLLIQSFEQDNKSIQRRFSIDSLESCYPFTSSSPWPATAQDWFQQEQATLARYLETIS